MKCEKCDGIVEFSCGEDFCECCGECLYCYNESGCFVTVEKQEHSYMMCYCGEEK